MHAGPHGSLCFSAFHKLKQLLLGRCSSYDCNLPGVTYLQLLQSGGYQTFLMYHLGLATPELCTWIRFRIYQ